MLGQEGFGTGEVLGGVDADGLDVGEADADAVAVLQPTELFQTLGLLKGRLGQLGDFA